MLIAVVVIYSSARSAARSERLTSCKASLLSQGVRVIRWRKACTDELSLGGETNDAGTLGRERVGITVSAS